MRDYFRKKDNFEDKKRIKRIIFLELGEVSKIQTTPKLSLHSLFQIYPSDYIESINFICNTAILICSYLIISLRGTIARK